MTKFIPLAYVPVALHNSKLILTPSKGPNFVVNGSRQWTRHVERFLGFANYHRSFIKDFAKISGPLYEITGKAKLQWKQPQQQAFDSTHFLGFSFS
jgi:hypothetical protein